MTISSQALTGDELARFLQMQLDAKFNDTEDELNKALGQIVRDVIASLADKDRIKQAIAAKIRQKFPQITGI